MQLYIILECNISQKISDLCYVVSNTNRYPRFCLFGGEQINEFSVDSLSVPSSINGGLAGWQIMHSLQMLRVSYKNHHIFSSFLTASIVVHVFPFFFSVIAPHNNCLISFFERNMVIQIKILLYCCIGLTILQNLTCFEF